MIPQPNNVHSVTNPVGRFMVAVGALIVHESTGKIAIVQRASTLDWHPNEWEITYGRIDQHEDPEHGLRREIAEEIGLTDIHIQKILRVWHIYRGPKSVENDLIGITYLATSASNVISLSDEHQAYEWVTPEEALKRISVPGIRQDIEEYISTLQKQA